MSHSPIAGAWELVSETEAGLIVATDTYASAIFVARDRSGFHASQPTQTEEAAAYRTFAAQAGPYTVTGSRVTHHRIYTRNPNVAGTDEHFEFRIDGQRMWLQSVREDGTHGPEMLWRKAG